MYAMHVEIRQYINTSISKLIIDVIFDIRCTVHVGAYMRVVVYVCVLGVFVILHISHVSISHIWKNIILFTCQEMPPIL